MVIPEYGRSIHMMVEHAKTLPNKIDRNRAANTIIDVMGQLNPHLRDVDDFRHKLWDHLFLIADYNLDVDSPYPIPTKPEGKKAVDRLMYPANKIRIKHYGIVMERMLGEAAEMEEGEQKKRLVEMLANFMKLQYRNWNKSILTDEDILNDIKRITNGNLHIPEEMVLDIKPISGNMGTGSQQNRRNNNYRNKGKSNFKKGPAK